MNEDYIKGIKFLLNEAKEQGINIRNVQWVPHVSKLLSEHNLCYKFWHNAWQQNKLDRVPLCKTWYDILYEPSKYLFCWSQTFEGYTFWITKLSEVLGIKELYGNEASVLNRWLYD